MKLKSRWLVHEVSGLLLLGHDWWRHLRRREAYPGGDLAAVERAKPATVAGIVDLSGIPLERLRVLDDPDVSESLEHVLDELDDPYSVRAGGSNPSHAE